MGVRWLAVANGPNIFQMLLVKYFISVNLLSTERIESAYIDLLIPAYTVSFKLLCGSCKNTSIMHVKNKIPLCQYS